jgi:hypothetical protein
MILQTSIEKDAACPEHVADWVGRRRGGCLLLPFCEQAEWEPWVYAVMTDPQVHSSNRVARMGDKLYEPRWNVGWDRLRLALSRPAG